MKPSATSLILLVIYGTFSDGFESSIDLETWDQFKVEFVKSYANQYEHDYRMRVFLDNKRNIDQLNSENGKSTLVVNRFSDLTNQEFYEGKLEKRTPLVNSPGDPKVKEFLDNLLNDKSELPKEILWTRVSNRVGPVRTLGRCYAGTAIVVASMLEGQLVVRMSNQTSLIPLSAQNIVDCGHHEEAGCEGTTVSQSIDSIISLGGIESEKDYTFRDGQEQCKFDKSKSVLLPKGYAYLPMYNRTALMRVLSLYGPISVDYSIEDHNRIRHWNGKSILRCKSPKSIIDLNTRALLVGYGTDYFEGDYWLMKNHWGISWGDGGYFRITRDSFNDCGLRTYPAIATF